jgi:hypothetical protein
MLVFTEAPNQTRWTAVGAALAGFAAGGQARRATRRWLMIGARKKGSRAHRPLPERS